MAARTVEHIEIIRIPGVELGAGPAGGFVFGSFCASMRRSARMLADLLDEPGVTLALATPIGSDTLVGWIATKPAENRIIFAYTKAAYRASPEQRKGVGDRTDAFCIASTLAIESGIDFARPVLCSFWSRAAKSIAARHGNPYNIRRG